MSSSIWLILQRIEWMEMLRVITALRSELQKGSTKEIGNICRTSIRDKYKEQNAIAPPTETAEEEYAEEISPKPDRQCRVGSGSIPSEDYVISNGFAANRKIMYLLESWFHHHRA
uniref:Uncharacterized protein n=1 Tax=Ditylenchus dipsaci TaxID=166011 RepID=A0A915DVK5_9BILA